MCVSVCVCVQEREGECVCERVQERDGESVCVCVKVRVETRRTTTLRLQMFQKL